MDMFPFGILARSAPAQKRRWDQVPGLSTPLIRRHFVSDPTYI